MRKYFLLFYIAFTVLGLVSTSLLAKMDETVPDHYVVQDLSNYEVYRGQTFQDNLLWVGRRNVDAPTHRLQVFDATGKKLIKTIKLPHNVREMHPYGKTGVLILGQSYEDQYYTYYSIITKTGRTHRLQSYRFNPVYQLDHVAFDGRDFYFAEIGTRKLLKMRAGQSRLKTVLTAVSNPGPVVVQDKAVWLLERRGPEQGNESLVNVALGSSKKNTVSGEQYLYGAVDLIGLADKNLIAVAETGIGPYFDAEGDIMKKLEGDDWQISFWDSNTNKLVTSVDLDARLRSIERFGNCVVGMDGLRKKMVFVSFAGDEAFKVVDTWDLSVEGYGLNSPRDVSINVDKGLFFTRSSTPSRIYERVNRGNAVIAYSKRDSVAHKACL